MKKINFFLIGIFLFLFVCSSCTTNSPILDSALEEAQYAGTSVPLDVRLRGVWLAGGSDENGPLAAVDLYDPLTDTWYPDITRVPTPRAFVGVAVADEKIYVIGGINTQGETSELNEVFDIRTHRWSRGINLPVGIQGAQLASIGGKIYLAGGSMTPDAEGAFSKILKMNNNSNFWVSLYDIGGINTYFRVDGAAATLDGILYYMGGRTEAGTYVNTNYGNYVMDYIGTFTGTVLPQQRVALSASSFSSGEKKYILLTGGVFTTGVITQPNSGVALNTFYYYIPIINTQSMNTGPVMNSSRAYHGSVVWRNSLYVFGGYDNGSFINTFEYIEDLVTPTPLSTASWTVGSLNMPRARYGFQAVTNDGQ